MPQILLVKLLTLNLNRPITFSDWLVVFEPRKATGKANEYNCFWHSLRRSNRFEKPCFKNFKVNLTDENQGK